MPIIQISYEDARSMQVDRDSIRNDFGREGFSIYISGLEIKFEDENDAAILAKKILYRVGEK